MKQSVDASCGQSKVLGTCKSTSASQLCVLLQGGFKIPHTASRMSGKGSTSSELMLKVEL